MPSAAEEELIAADKMAAALVFLSQGIPFMQAGQELLRSKPDPDGGFVHDSYNSPDSVNSIKWNDVTIHRSVMEYYKGLIAIRKNYPVLRLRTGDEIREKLSYEPAENGAVIAHIGNLLLLVNPGDEPLERRISGKADILADSRKASAEPLYSVEGTVTAAPHSVTLAEIR